MTERPIASQGWFRALTPPERRTFAACFAGWALDGFDFQLYPLIIPTLIGLWHIDAAKAGQLGTVTLVMSAVGGWLAGQLADRIGRVRTLQITILWFSIFTFLSGLCQSIDQLFWARSLMGLGFGGEWTAGSVLMAEVVAARHRGKAVGMVQSAWSIGWGLAVLAAALLLNILPADWGWRVLFMLGILPAFLLFFIRRQIEEPVLYRQLGDDRPARIRTIFSRRWLATTLPAALMMTGMQGGYHAIVTWLPTFLRLNRGLSVLGSSSYLAVVIIGSFCGYCFGALLTDLLGRRRQILLFSVCCLVTVWGYTRLEIDDHTMLILGFPLGFFSSGIFSGIGAYLSELYPTAIRGAGQGFCYNFGRGVGALIPWMIGLLSVRLGLGQAVGLFAAGSYLLVFVAISFLPETRGRELME